MCTIVVAAHVFPGTPVVVVANRDERLDRASSPPFVWPEGFLAPRDDVAGGTWLGVNHAGVFVGITNRYLGPQDPERASRGVIVRDALALGSARAIHDAMARVPPARHNGFHLVVADAHDVLVTASNGTHLAQLTLGKGLHMITERSFGAGDDAPRIRRIRAAWARLAPAGATVDLERLAQLLTEHDDADPLGATCIHLPAFRYGTRSGTALALPDEPEKRRMLWADGPPCMTPFAPVPAIEQTR
jgi:uncharacterized protein with NRDE domain